MKRDMPELNVSPVSSEGQALDIERECELWDWARAAGASAQDLRKALRELLGGASGLEIT